MSAEHILDALGLLDDDLIQEAEDYSVQKRRSGPGGWVSLAASFAVVIVLGYWLSHGIGMGGGSAGPDEASGGASGSPPASASVLPPREEHSGGGENLVIPNGSVSEPLPSIPEAPGPEDMTEDWLMVDGTVYRATREYIDLEPEEGEVRYTTSLLHGAAPEEDGQANLLPVGTAYTALEDGRVAVLEDDSWRVYEPVPPGER